MEDSTLHEQLLDVSAASEEPIDEVLRTLWSTRKTGLSLHQKSTLHSLLKLSSPKHLDSVLACLRSIIRMSVKEDLNEDGIKKLFPSNLPKELQSTFVTVLRKYQAQWKDEASMDQPLCRRIRTSNHVKARAPLPLTLSASELSSFTWPRKDDFAVHSDCRSDACHELTALPHLKSMTWTIENRNLVPANRLAVITLKLEDNTKSPPGETEIKFHLSRDTLEAMLRSMTYIDEQLSKSVTPASATVEKQN